MEQLFKKLNIERKNLVLSDASNDIIIYKNKEKGIEEIKEYICRFFIIILILISKETKKNYDNYS